MSTLTTLYSPPVEDCPKPDTRHTSEPRRPDFESHAADALQPNVLVRWAFYLSVLGIPFTRLYLPGTGERIGVTRMIQALILGAILSQPRVCIRLMPVALFWFLAYCGWRLLSGLWFTPELSSSWWPNTLDWLQFSLPWVWLMFNVLQFPTISQTQGSEN